MVKKFDPEIRAKNIDESEKRNQPPTLVLVVILTFLGMLFFMSIYEWLKDALFPNMSIWGSHIITIVFTTSLATVMAYFVTRKLYLQYELVQKAVERKRAEEAILKSEEKYRSLVESTEDSICLVDRDATYLFVNKKHLSRLGSPMDKVIGKTYGEFHPIDDTEEFEGRIEELFEIGQTVQYEHINLKDDRYFLRSLSPVKDADGNTTSVTVVSKDITDFKSVEKSLKESEKRFRTVADFTYDWESWVGPDGQYIYVSPSCERITGYSSEEFMKDPELLTKIVHPDDRERISMHLGGQLKDAGAEDEHIDFRIMARGGDVRWISHSCQPVNDEDGNWLGIRSSNRDITNRMKLRDKLVQSQKMEAIGTLAGGIAHDFNNILSAVIGYTQISMDLVEKETILQSNLNAILNAGFRAKSLIQQILTFSRQGDQEQKPVYVKLLAKEALKLLRASLPSTVEIRQEILSDSAMLADPTQIHQVLMNLGTNAGHAMSENGGVLEVSLTDEELDVDFTAPQDGMAPGSYIKLTVSDTGRGMSSQVLEKIFDPYFTTKEEGEGTGMGLSVVHGIVKNCGGTVTVYSDPGKGTTFNVFLPIIDTKGEPQAATDKPLPTGTERILFVDDEETLVDLGKLILGRLGYKVVTRTNSIEALELFKAQPDYFDLIITDMSMPNMTGVDLAREVMKIRTDIPIILCTGYSTLISEERAEEMGFKAFIMKPLLRQDLAETIRRVLPNRK